MYNAGGNIVSKNEYVYTSGELGTPTKVYNYSYDNSWKDQLTSFDGNAIVYDAGGEVVVPRRLIKFLEKKYNSNKSLSYLCDIYFDEYLS